MLPKLTDITAEVRQGGLLSTLLFVVYINDIIESLTNSKLDCHIGSSSK